ncbi:hypothetical protein GCM10010371_05450 [Streptomyces subrutilus]|uniref:Uncharacterized protein n=1 Tax=Streptomyces subrutilus TaxID=36818 RepID=A0A918V054_9ACTN|nr:hypothetical protein GCM10010371_05450 [Streptomyces subrutilus]
MLSPPRVADGAEVSEGVEASSIRSGLVVNGGPLGGEESAEWAPPGGAGENRKLGEHGPYGPVTYGIVSMAKQGPTATGPRP